MTPDYSAALSSPVPPLRFQDFPYAIDPSGYMSRLKSPKRWSARSTFEFGQDSYGLERTGLGLLLEHQTGAGLDFQWNSYREDLGGGVTDELHFSDINFLYRVAEHENYLVRAGLGINILGDAFETDTGINFTARLDVFPVKPIAITTEFDLGTIGDAETIHGAIRAGVMLNRFELFGGYDYRRIGSIELKGPMAGLQVWF